MNQEISVARYVRPHEKAAYTVGRICLLCRAYNGELQVRIEGSVIHFILSTCLRYAEALQRQLRLDVQTMFG